MNHRENLIRAYCFNGPEYVPLAAGMPWIVWEDFGYDPQDIDAVLLKHEILFPGYQKGDVFKFRENVKSRPDLIKGNKYKDGWDCVWETAYTGMVGSVTYHALSDWSRLDDFIAPKPDEHDGMYPLDWDKIKENRDVTRKNGDFFAVGLPHGHTFLRIQDLRGYENLIFDMFDDSPELNKALKMIEEFNIALIQKYIELEPDAIYIPEDLGMQKTPMLSPDMFKKYIKPIYMSMTKPIKEKGILVHEHSDGFILPLIDDIIESGGDIINMQDLVNGIDEIEKNVKGRIAIDLDIDRQDITVNGTPKEIDNHIKEAVSKLGSKEGGLSLVYQPWPPTPVENMDAVFTAMEKYKNYEF